MSESANPVEAEERADKRRDPKPTKKQLEAALKAVQHLLVGGRDYAPDPEAKQRFGDACYPERFGALSWSVNEALKEIGKVLS